MVPKRGSSCSGHLLGRLVDGTDELTAPDYRPRDGALTNREALTEADHFLGYARRIGRRATPHNL